VDPPVAPGRAPAPPPPESLYARAAAASPAPTRASFRAKVRPPSWPPCRSACWGGRSSPATPTAPLLRRSARRRCVPLPPASCQSPRALASLASVFVLRSAETSCSWGRTRCRLRQPPPAASNQRPPLLRRLSPAARTKPCIPLSLRACPSLLQLSSACTAAVHLIDDVVALCYYC
jgi:hypothetical protein